MVPCPAAGRQGLRAAGRLGLGASTPSGCPGPRPTCTLSHSPSDPSLAHLRSHLYSSLLKHEGEGHATLIPFLVRAAPQGRLTKEWDQRSFFPAPLFISFVSIITPAGALDVSGTFGVVLYRQINEQQFYK